MLKDIASNKFVEYGQHDGFYYGTKYDSIRDCIRGGRMCVLDISPQVRGVEISTEILKKYFLDDARTFMKKKNSWNWSRKMFLTEVL